MQKNMAHALECFKLTINFNRTSKAIAVQNSLSGVKIWKPGLLPFPYSGATLGTADLHFPINVYRIKVFSYMGKLS